MSEPIDVSRHDAVLVLTLNNPPVNALSAELRASVMRVLAEAESSPEVAAVVIAGSGRGFCAGADIREFGGPPPEPGMGLVDIISRIEHLSKPVVAAIHGMALGGGLELALGCHYRIGLASASLGQPEIKLGMTPGAGATQRLPRLIGIEASLELILTGEPITGSEALTLGLLDEVVDEPLLAAATRFASGVATSATALRRTRDLGVKRPENDSVFDRYRSRVERRSRGLLAPGLCIQAVENALRMPFDEALAAERAVFLRTRDSDQARAHRHLFFAERQATRVPVLPAGRSAPEIDSAAVIGGGTMGRGIAICFANAGLPVRVLEQNAERLDLGLDSIRATYRAAVEKSRISAEQMAVRLDLISGSLAYQDIADVDIVIEAVNEDMALKKAVFADLDRACRPETILATNTSTLDVDEIAATTGRPNRVMGTHFFSPAHVMPLMENVRGKETSIETVAAVMRLSKQLGKVGVLVGVCDGFVGNRMLRAYTRQANFLLEEGALPQQVDRVMYDFGFAMGPFAVADLAGLDVGWHVRRHQATRRPPDERYSPIADRICELGRFGQKTGAGWYRYEKGDRTPIPDPDIEGLIESVSRELGIRRRSISDTEILERCLYPLINEGARILEEGVAGSPGDIDVIWVRGYGFPIFRGGPLFYADAIGPSRVLDAMRRFEAEHGSTLAPASLLEDLVAAGKGFHDR